MVKKILLLFFIVCTNAISQYRASDLFEYIKDTYNREEKKLNDFLITEISQYINTFPDSQNAPGALFMLGKIYEKKHKPHEALGCYLKLLYLYPHSSQRRNCSEAIQLIIAKEKAYRYQVDTLRTIARAEVADTTFVEAYFQYLQLLVELNQGKLYNWVIKEANNFFYSFPRYDKNDIVLRWIADFYARKGKNREAAENYLKLDYLFPDSPLIPYARYSRAMLLYRKLSNYNKATDVFQEIVTDYEGSSFAGLALFYLGEINEKKQKKYQEAIDNYRKLVDNYPDHEKAVEALWRIGEINYKKLNQYFDAIAAYNEIVEKYSTDEQGVEALKKIAEIYEKKIKDFAEAAASYAKIARIYPAYKKAPEMLIKAGSICENKLKDYKLALKYYQAVLETFPSYKKIEKVKKKINKLSQKK